MVREQNRRSQGYNERKKAIEDRESIKWLESLESSQQKLPPTVKTITVADREADIYRFLIQHQQLGADFVTSRENPNQPATVAFTLEEWKSLYCVIHKDTIGKTTPIPDKPPSIHQCVKWIAQLGGFLGRKGDGEPGVKTLWLGLQRLKDITSTWVMTRELQIEEVLAA